MKAKTITAFAIKNNFGIRYSSINPIKRDVGRCFDFRFNYSEKQNIVGR